VSRSVIECRRRVGAPLLDLAGRTPEASTTARCRRRAAKGPHSALRIRPHGDGSASPRATSGPRARLCRPVPARLDRTAALLIAMGSTCPSTGIAGTGPAPVPPARAGGQVAGPLSSGIRSAVAPWGRPVIGVSPPSPVASRRNARAICAPFRGVGKSTGCAEHHQAPGGRGGQIGSALDPAGRLLPSRRRARAAGLALLAVSTAPTATASSRHVLTRMAEDDVALLPVPGGAHHWVVKLKPAPSTHFPHGLWARMCQ